MGQKKHNMGGEERMLQEVLKNKKAEGTEEPALSYFADFSVHFLL